MSELQIRVDFCILHFKQSDINQNIYNKELKYVIDSKRVYSRFYLMIERNDLDKLIDNGRRY